MSAPCGAIATCTGVTCYAWPLIENRYQQNMTTLTPLCLLDLLESRRYAVEYQPIMALKTREIMAFEALARFKSAEGHAIPPQAVFSALHHSPLSLYQTEYHMKRLQLAEAPKDYRLFLNLDPDACAFEGHQAQADFSSWMDCLRSRPDIVVEIIENSNVSDAHISRRLAEACHANQIELALDDIGAPDSLVALSLLLSVDYLKFDRSWLAQRNDPPSMTLLTGLIRCARDLGKHTVLEGIETEADLDFAHTLGVNYVQGFLFKPLFRYSH